MLTCCYVTLCCADVLLCFVSAARAVARSDVALYVGLAVALVVFPMIALLALKLYRRKERGQSMYGLTERGKKTKMCTLLDLEYLQ